MMIFKPDGAIKATSWKHTHFPVYVCLCVHEVYSLLSLYLVVICPVKGFSPKKSKEWGGVRVGNVDPR